MDSEAVSDATSTSHHGDLICQKDSTSETEDKLLGPGDHGLLQAIKSECDETVLELLSAPGNRFSQKTLDNALFEMCKAKGRKRCSDSSPVEKLLDLGANFESVSEDGWKPVLVAASTGNADVLKSLLNRGANVNAFNTDGNSALILSIRPDRSLDIIKLLLLQRGIDTDHKNHQGYTALMKAMEAKDIEAMQILLYDYTSRNCQRLPRSFDSDQMLKNFFGQYFFHFVSSLRMVELIKLLLHYGASALMEAALKADVELVGFFVHSRFYKISALDYGNKGFLHTFFEEKTRRNIAIGDIDIPVVEMLLESGISVNLPEDGYRSSFLEPPIVTAVTAGSYGLVQLMCKYGAMLEVTARYTGKTPVYLAAESGRADILQLLIDNNASLRSSEYKDSPLHFCLRNGHTKCAEILLTLGIEIDFKSAVECAIESNKKESIKFLLKRCVSSVRNVFQVNINQMLTPLAKAVNNDHIDVINSLLEAKIILPHFLLSHSSSVAMVKLLVSHGASVNQKSDSGDSVLHLILIRSKCSLETLKEIVEILLQYGANVNDTDSEGLTPLMVAAQLCHNKDVLNILLLHGADINMKDYIGTTALMHALNYHNREITKCLVEYEGKHTIEEDDCGDTALTTAARKGDTYTLMKLIEKGADINHQNKYGCSALMFAAAVFDKDSIEVLLDAGADVNLVNLVSHGQQKMTAISLLLKNATLFYRCRLSLMPDLYSPMDSLLKKGATSSYLQPSDFFYFMEIEEYIFIPRLVCSGFGPPDFCLSEGDEPPQFSPFFWALVKGKPSLARYFQNIWFLTKTDIYLQTKHQLAAKLVARDRALDQKCLDILNEFCSQPMSLLKLSFVTVSSAIGCVPGREEKIKQLLLPEVMKEKLLFKHQDEEERELAEEMNFLHI